MTAEILVGDESGSGGQVSVTHLSKTFKSHKVSPTLLIHKLTVGAVFHPEQCFFSELTFLSGPRLSGRTLRCVWPRMGTFPAVPTT